MTGAPSTEEILLREYAEAGATCRQIEQLVRMSLAVFLPSATALVGFLVGARAHPLTNFALSGCGLIVTLLLLNTVLRSQAYYKRYLMRAKTIEGLIKRDGAPVMSLYSGASGAPTGSRTFSNKSAIGWVFALAAIFFVAATGLFGWLAAQ